MNDPKNRTIPESPQREEQDIKSKETKAQKNKGEGKEFEKSSSPSADSDNEKQKKELGDETQIDDETTI